MAIEPVRVFLVEDMPHLRSVLEDLLHSVGNFRVVGTAGTEAEANFWLEEHPRAWDLLIADLVLDQGTGFGVIKKCRQRPDSRKVVVLSDYVTPGIHRHCLALGADAAIPKSDMPSFLDFLGAVGVPAAPRPAP
ncbi:response regulator [Ramlibacter sp. RBP-2]|uniref:Response regulator n=1 Tax=Ramlibacter lithotrophicus TaxID=2606681 RepID=A0A7X6DG67_9BURK|nr:response regulator [Ramlibacter lithotrophicus]NKE66586.1 response regulator [Ramlibacter lithotrophicus]